MHQLATELDRQAFQIILRMFDVRLNFYLKFFFQTLISFKFETHEDWGKKVREVQCAAKTSKGATQPIAATVGEPSFWPMQLRLSISCFPNPSLCLLKHYVTMMRMTHMMCMTHMMRMTCIMRIWSCITVRIKCFYGHLHDADWLLCLVEKR